MKTADKLLIQHGFDLAGQKINPNKKKRKKDATQISSPKVLSQNKWLIKQRAQSTPSPSETEIIQFLVENGVQFLREAYLPSLVNPQTGKLLFFDFYVPSHNIFIEFDGLHHYKNPDRAALKEQKYRDRLKNEFCQKNGFALLRIKYTDRDPRETICRKLDELSGI